jgi:outer membrane protein OmpA-like peptidoglycan-associated protein
VEIKADGTLGEPINLGEKVNTEGQEMFPWITNEGLLFLASDGHTGLGGLDIFVVIPKKDGSFNKLINVGRPVNSSKDDFALVMNADNLAGYVSSNRTSGKGDDDIYALKLLKPFKVNLSLIGLVKDKNSEALLPGAKVDLLDESGSLVASVISDNNGNYEFGLERNMDYSITVSKDDYFDNSVVTSTKNLPDGTEEIKMDLNLEKDPGLSVYVLITDSKTKSPLGDVTIQLVNNMTGKSASYTTNAKGDMIKPLADKKLNDRGSYNFVLSKDGYIPKTVTYNVVFDKEGQYDVHSAIDLSMDPVVADLRDLIEINPISFDLGKWNIRPDAKVELDKIVEVMNKYPGMVVELGSHTDCRASKTFNMRLSDKRAKSSAAYIKSKITDPERIYGKGYGESRLLNGCECEGAVKSNCSEEEHEKNRRTEFKVISIGDNKSDVINNSDDSFRD